MIDIEKEKKEDSEFRKVYNKQNKIRKEFAFLEKVDEKHFQAEFVRAQAKEICNYIFRLRLSPFKSWELIVKEIINDEDRNFLYDFFLTENEHGELVPDEERINKLILSDPDPEEYPDSRR